MVVEQHPDDQEIAGLALAQLTAFSFSSAEEVFVRAVAGRDEVDCIEGELQAYLRKDIPHRNSMKMRNIRKELPKPCTW